LKDKSGADIVKNAFCSDKLYDEKDREFVVDSRSSEFAKSITLEDASSDELAGLLKTDKVASSSLRGFKKLVIRYESTTRNSLSLTQNVYFNPEIRKCTLVQM